MHVVTSALFLLIFYSDYLSSAGKQLQCPGKNNLEKGRIVWKLTQNM